MATALTAEQAQAVADVIATVSDGRWGVYDELAARFPDTDWISLCEADAADPRPRTVTRVNPYRSVVLGPTFTEYIRKYRETCWKVSGPQRLAWAKREWVRPHSEPREQMPPFDS